MKKTKNITKYEVEWQMIRVSLKGNYNKDNKDLSAKLNKAIFYFNETKSYERWERVFNWMEGLYKGFHKNGEHREKIQEKILYLKKKKPSESFVKEKGFCIEKLSSYSDEDKLLLWKDLFRTNIRWLKRGYNHSEINQFMEILYTYINTDIDQSFSIDVLRKYRSNSKFVKSTHKFFF